MENIHTLYDSTRPEKGIRKFWVSQRPNGVAHGIVEHCKCWKDARIIEQDFVGQEPPVLIIGLTLKISVID